MMTNGRGLEGMNPAAIAAAMKMKFLQLGCHCGSMDFRAIQVCKVLVDKIDQRQAAPQIIGHEFICVDCNCTAAYDRKGGTWIFPDEAACNERRGVEKKPEDPTEPKLKLE